MTIAPPVSGLEALDRLSEQLLAAAGDIRVAVAQTPAEREAVHRLRHRQVVAEGWAQPDELPAGLEVDDHDASALQIGAWDGDRLLGCMRLVLPVPGRALPVEEAFDVRVEPSGQVVEAGRLVIARELRGEDPAHRVWGALFACAWLTMRARGLSLLAGAASPRMVERLRGFGLPFEVLGPARLHWGAERVPVRLDPASGDPGWYQG